MNEVEEEIDTQQGKFLTFHLGDEDYGIAISFVTEIIGLQIITEVPETPHYFKGVINLRGKVIPVIDVRLRMGMESREYDERSCIVVVDHNNNSVGLVVDTVAEVLDIPDEAIEPSPYFSNGSQGFVEGMGKIGDDIKMLIDIKALLEGCSQAGE